VVKENNGGCEMKFGMLALVILFSSATLAEDNPELIYDDGGWGAGLDGKVGVIEDKKRNVVCYVFDGYKAGGIFCFTKDQLEATK
jgi:hypothetical protein